MARGSFSLALLLVCSVLDTISGLDLAKLPNVRGQDLGKNKYAVRVKECYLKNKTNFEGCLFQFWQEVAPLLKIGLPELNVPSLDPLLIDQFNVNENLGSVKGEAKFTNVKIVGASAIIPVSVKVDTKAKLVIIAVKFPQLNSTGNYMVKGEVMLMPLNGNGTFQLDLTDVNAVIKVHIGQKGTGVMVNKVALDFTIGKIFIKAKGLMGDDTVDQAINNMLNDNSQEILADIKPVVGKKFEEIFFNLAKDAFIDMPSDAFIG